MFTLPFTLIALALLLAHALYGVTPPPAAHVPPPVFPDRRVGGVRVRAGHLVRVRAARQSAGLPVWPLALALTPPLSAPLEAS